MTKTIIKDFLKKYTVPNWDGQSADELAGMLEEALKQNEVNTREAVKLGGIDGLFSEALEALEKVKIEKKPLELRKITFDYDRVDNDFSLSRDDELNL